MVVYCCVKSCSNSSNSVKKDKRSISFHAFPSNNELKLKWLRAIGRPNWDPPNYVRICSIHFSSDKVNQDGYRTRIKEDACPVKELPPNSNFEASCVKVCRMCLATDTKMYSLEYGIFKVCFETLTMFSNKDNIEGLPQYICFECGACILKCCKLVEKSMVAQATLLDIFAQYGKITKSLVMNRDRKQLNLKSPLEVHQGTSSNYFEYLYDDEQKISFQKETCKDEPQAKLELPAKDMKYNKKERCFALDNVEESENTIEPDKNNDSLKIWGEDLKHEDIKDNETDSESISNYPLEEQIDDLPEDQCEVKDINIISDSSEVFSFKGNKENNKKNMTGFTPNEIDMHKYFNIVTLSLQEQIMEWNKRIENVPWNSKIAYKCEVCFKIYASVKSLKAHKKCHDPARGGAVCPVCKQRFKKEVLVKSHAKKMHVKAFHCKSCPKVFNNVSGAKKHHRWHVGHVYKCARCTFSTLHASALGNHVRARHEHKHACARCGHACVSRRGLALHAALAHADDEVSESDNVYKCEKCDISFNSEGARRVHLLTSKQHRKNASLTTTTIDPVLQTTCKRCGLSFASAFELTEHSRAEHMRTKKRPAWRLPGDSYPTQCEHCDAVLSTRGEHWAHVRRRHPAQRALYRPVVAAVCHACGRGFQNSTKLRIHELSHGSPRVRCGTCSRMFYDKYALARHAASHQPHKPHACGDCGRAFKLKSNLVRHSIVHSGVTPYECIMCGKKFKYSTSRNLHIRTVHHRLPPPPRRKRTRPAAPAPVQPNHSDGYAK